MKRDRIELILMLRDRPFPRFVHRVYILWTLVGFAFLIYLESRGWIGEAGEEKSKVLRRQAVRLRNRLIRLGPTFIKMGQMLATRADLLPLEYVQELSALQDNVPPFSDSQAMAVIEMETGRPIGEMFSDIGSKPIASASLGQVYAASLFSGERVAVKVQRPNLESIVAQDIEALTWLGRLADRFPGLFPGAEWLGAINEFDRVIHEEMDYRREAENLERFKDNFREWKSIFVPRTFKEFSSKRVLVMEFVSGTRINDLPRLGASGHSARHLNELLYRAYFKQLLEDGFFHADPHPGNLLVMEDGRLAFLDFGMVGTLSAELQRQMIDVFFHLYSRNINALVDDLVGLGFLKPEADMVSFRTVVANVFARKLNLPLREVRIRDLTYDLAPIMYEYPITTPARFTFLIRAIMTLEGVSIVMNPDFVFFEVAGPYVRDFLFKRESARLRQMAFDSLKDAQTGRFEWDRLWTMAKMVFSLAVGRI